MLTERISLFEFKLRNPPGTYLIPVTIMQAIPLQESGWVNVLIIYSYDLLNSDNDVVFDSFSFVNHETGLTVAFLPLRMLNAWYKKGTSIIGLFRIHEYVAGVANMLYVVSCKGEDWGQLQKRWRGGYDGLLNNFFLSFNVFIFPWCK